VARIAGFGFSNRLGRTIPPAIQTSGPIGRVSGAVRPRKDGPMDPSVVLTLTLISVILILGIVSTKLASRIGVPALVLFIGAGMLVGPGGPGAGHL